MKDPEFLADAKKAPLDIRSGPAEDVEKAAARFSNFMLLS
jgi:hypothetical protein